MYRLGLCREKSKSSILISLMHLSCGTQQRQLSVFFIVHSQWEMSEPRAEDLERHKKTTSSPKLTER